MNEAQGLTELILWLFMMGFAVIGYGRAALRLLGLWEIPWAIAGSLGVAVLLLLGGLVNLAGLVGAKSWSALIVAGVSLFLLFGLRLSVVRALWQALRDDRMAAGFAVGLLAITALSLPHALREPGFDFSDDLSAYVNFPVKTFQLGSLPAEPFSERRITSSLGAGYFLESGALVAGDITALGSIDRGLGVLLFAGCVFALARSGGFGLPWALAATLLATLLPQDRTNLSLTTLPAALFAGILWIGLHRTHLRRQLWPSGPIALGLLAAGAIALKSSNLPFAVLVCACILAAAWWQERQPRSLPALCICAGSAAVALLPWMLDMKRKEGTALFPVLGKGYEIAAFGPIPHAAHAGAYPWIVSAPFLLAFAVLALALWPKPATAEDSAQTKLRQTAGAALSAGIALVLISVSVGGASVTRYTMPFQLPVLLLATFALVWNDRSLHRTRRIAGRAVAAILLLNLAYYGATHGSYGKALSPRFEPKLDISSERLRAAHLQAAIPAGEPVLSYLKYTYAFDFLRNDMLIADFPGMAGLPPGMPIEGSPDDTRDYLLAKHIKYVAISRDRIAGDEIGLRSPARRGWSWPRMQGDVRHDTCLRLLDLDAEYLSAYDDGDEVVIDLNKRR